jgi:hypothetical protein
VASATFAANGTAFLPRVKTNFASTYFAFVDPAVPVTGTVIANVEAP